jgi:hypothetical protein
MSAIGLATRVAEPDQTLKLWQVENRSWWYDPTVLSFSS